MLKVAALAILALGACVPLFVETETCLPRVIIRSSGISSARLGGAPGPWRCGVCRDRHRLTLFKKWLWRYRR